VFEITNTKGRADKWQTIIIIITLATDLATLVVAVTQLTRHSEMVGDFFMVLLSGLLSRIIVLAL